MVKYISNKSSILTVVKKLARAANPPHQTHVKLLCARILSSNYVCAKRALALRYGWRFPAGKSLLKPSISLVPRDNAIHFWISNDFSAYLV